MIKHLLLATCITCACVSIAQSASKLTTKTENDKTVTIQTRTLPAIRETIFDTSIHRIREPAPANACKRPAFEILNRLPNEPQCVNLR